MRKKPFLSILTLTLALVVLLALAASFALSRLNVWALRTIESALQMRVTLGDVHVSVRKGLGIGIEDFSLFDPEGGGEPLFSAEHLFVGLDLRSLVRGEIRILRVYGFRPKILLCREEGGHLNLERLYTPRYVQEKLPGEMQSHPLARSLGPVLWKNWILLEEGEVVYRDPALPAPSFVRIRNVFFHLRSALLRDELHVELSGEIAEPAGGGTWSLSGDLDRWKHARSPAELGARLSLSFQQVSASDLSRFLPVKARGQRLSGTVRGSASYEGGLLLPGRIRIDLEVEKPLWDHPGVHTSPFAPTGLGLSLSGEIGTNQLAMDHAEIRLGGLRIRGEGALLSKSGPFSDLELRLEGKGLPLAEAKQYLPLRLLRGKVWPFLVAMTREGTVDARADLVGALSDFSRLESPEAENALKLFLLFHDVTILLPVEEPFLPFRNVKGRLDLQDGNLLFRDFAGSYGKARLSRGRGLIRGIHQSSSSLEIEGEGPFDVSEAVHELDHGLFPNELRAVARQIHDAQGTGTFRVELRHDFGHGADGRIHVQGRVDIDRVRVRYSSWPLALDEATGTIEFSDSSIRTFALAFKAGKTPLEARGRVTFKGSESGATEAEVQLSSPSLDLGDLMHLASRDQLFQGALPAKARISFDGDTRTWEAEAGPGHATLSVGRYELPLDAVEASFSGRGQTLDIRRISFLAQGSPVTCEGRVDSLSPFAGRLKAAAAVLDLDALLARKRTTDSLRDLVRSNRKPSATRQTSRLDLDVHIGSFSRRPLRFENMRIRGSVSEGTVLIRDGRAESGNGHITFSGRVSKQEDRFPFGVRLSFEGVESEEVFRWLRFRSGLVKGPITLDGQAEGSFASGSQWMQTLGGTVRLETRDGLIERYDLLAKILTLVNVAQWSKVRLADLMTQGVPYRSIRGDLKIEKGVLSSPGVEIDSTIAMASLNGSYDLVQDRLAVLLSLRPLEQLDQVLDRLPVVGRIVQGPDGTIVIFYYRLEGPLKDPKVSLVPFRSLEEQPLWNLPAQTVRSWLKTVEEAFLGR